MNQLLRQLVQLANAKSTAANKKPVVLLVHDIVGGTAECLGDLIEPFQYY